MSEHTTGILGRYGRYLWGGAALLLLVVLLGSVVLSASSVGGAETDAQARAESLSGSVIEEDLTADLLARDITGTAYRDLTVRVQAGILSDDRFATVRIWRLDGALIYSTAQRDDVSVIADDDQWIEQALGGKTVSVLSSEGMYHDGLKRPNEELFQTFVPITLSDDGTVDGVVQIDERYSAIHNQAYRIWRPLQIVVFLLLIGVGVMFVRWLRQAAASVEHATPEERRLGHGRRAEDQDVRDVLARADRAERTARETKERLRELEAAVAAAPSTATATAALEELALKLRASEAEREELAATVLRLQGSLSERDADVALARDGSGSRADTKRINKLIADAESKVVAADRKAAAAEKKTQEAAKRASVTAERMLEIEAQLKEAEQKAADAQKFAATVDKRGASAEEQVADAERRALEAEQMTKEIGERAAQAEQQGRELAGQAAEAEKRATASEQRAAQAEQTIAATEQRAADAERKVAETAQLVTQAEGRASDAEKLAAKVEQRAAEAERRTADAEQRAVQAEQRAAAAVGEDAGGKRRDSGERRIAAELKRTEAERDHLVAKIRELERVFGEAQTRIEATERDLALANLQVTNAASATAASQALEERAQTAELRLADSEERFTDAQSRLADAEAKLADALTQLEEASAPRPSLGGNELEARIAELESARRADVVALQRAQESFANTQVELSNAMRKLKEAETRVRELERGGHTRPAPAAKKADGDADAVPDYVTASDDGRPPSDDVDDLADVDDGYPSLEAFGDGGAPHTWETTGPPPEPEPTVEEPEEEGLSLRERLARAAAGRKRLS